MVTSILSRVRWRRRNNNRKKYGGEVDGCSTYGNKKKRDRGMATVGRIPRKTICMLKGIVSQKKMQHCRKKAASL